jgi:hypothetical protein
MPEDTIYERTHKAMYELRAKQMMLVVSSMNGL